MAFLTHCPEVSSISGCRREAPAEVISNRTRNINSLTIWKNSCTVRLRGRVRVRVRVRVGSRVKDLDARVSNLEHNVMWYGQFSAPLKPETTISKEKKEDDEKQNYYVNTGYAIRTLREEFPKLFHSELSFDIYRDDIVFKDPLNTFVGIENYKSIFWALRFHGMMFFKALWIDIITVWQPVEDTIMVRWTVHGIPRVPWDSRGRFDGTSEYKLDKNGKIFEHQVHNIALSGPTKFRVLAMEDLIQSLGCPSTPKPTFYKTSSSSIMNSVALIWVKHYLASIFSSTRRCEGDSSRST